MRRINSVYKEQYKEQHEHFVRSNTKNELCKDHYKDQTP